MNSAAGMLSLSAGMTTTSSSLSSSSSPSPRGNRTDATTPHSLTINEVVNANTFLMSKNLINTETLLLNELVLDLNNNTNNSNSNNNMVNNMGFDSTGGYLTSTSSASLSRPTNSTSSVNNLNLKIHKYKLFAEQTDQTSLHISKQIARLAELFSELKKSIQSQLFLIEQINEPITSLAKNSFSNELNSIFDGFTLAGRLLADNLKSFLNSFIELTLNPIELISQNFDTIEKEQAKRALDKAFKIRSDIKYAKHRKSQKSIDLSSISNTFLSDETASIEKTTDGFYLHQKICEYLSHVYAEKTSSFNQLVKSLMEFYKSQMTYLERSLRTMTSLGDMDEMRIETLLKKFNTDQSKETKIISELTARCCAQQHLQQHQLQQQPQPQNRQHYQSQKQTQHMAKSCENLSEATSSRLKTMSGVPSIVIKRSAERSPLFKSGYLLKKPHHQGVRNWLRRKCIAENGYLYIYHAEETESPVQLNLILCDVKVDDHRKFRIFSGSNNRVYDFMAESDEDLKEWVSILNTSKVDALEKELSTENSCDSGDSRIRVPNIPNEQSSQGFSRSVMEPKIRGSGMVSVAGVEDAKTQEYLVKSMIREVQSMEGNDKCCDCGSREADWLVTNLGILVCIECCGIHREMGVHISKTQSIKIDRLLPSQLVIARMSGNRLLNQIFEASILDASKKLHSKSTMDQRQKYIKIKYEQHLFSSQQNSNNLVARLGEIMAARATGSITYTTRHLFEIILQLFAQDYDIMAPFTGGIDDPHSRNILQFILDQLDDEEDYLFLVEFIVQNRDYPKNKYTINYHDRAGNTAVHHAVMGNRIESLKILLKANDIEANSKNYEGLSPSELATSLGFKECAEVLKKVIDTTTKTSECGQLSASCDYEQRSKPVIVKNGEKDENGKRTSKHNRVASDPFNLIKHTNSISNIKNFPRLLEDRKALHKSNKMSRNSEKILNRAINSVEYEQIDYSNKYKAIASYTSKNPNHLSFKQDDLIVVVDKSDDQYWNGFLDLNPQKRGFFPSNLVDFYV